MRHLPNHESAVLEISKIADYCLHPHHLRGRHKARVFHAALGIGRVDAEWLREELLDALDRSEAVELATDGYGSRWRVDCSVTRHGRTAMVRSLWIVRTGERSPRFVTCWID